MNKIMKMTYEELKKMKNILAEIEMFQSHEPEGCLKFQNKGKRTYLYHQYKDESSNQWKRRYIKDDNNMLARKLAQKSYYREIKPIVESNIEVLRKFIGGYRPETISDVYEEMRTIRRNLVEPVSGSRVEMLKQWQEEKYESDMLYKENLRYETEQGELVRSKSEVIIANILYQHKEDILYKYERPLHLMSLGKRKTIYPDFTILNVHTGKLTYWEHAGMLEEPTYAEQFVRKVNLYINNKLMPGEDVQFTYESETIPLDINVVKRVVERIIGS